MEQASNINGLRQAAKCIIKETIHKLALLAPQYPQAILPVIIHHWPDSEQVAECVRNEMEWAVSQSRDSRDKESAL